MGRLIRRRAAAAVVAALASALTAMPVGAVVIVYTLTISPLTAVVEQETGFVVVVTNVAGPDDLGCVELVPPATYEVISVTDPVASNQRNWTSTVNGGTVIAWTNQGGGRLRVLQSVTFTVTARPKEVGVEAWTHHAHQNHDCNDTTQVGIPVPVTITLPTLATPTPQPTVAPTTAPTPKPTLRPTAHPTVRPTAVPTPGMVMPTPAPTSSTSPTDRATTTSQASPTAWPTPAARPDLAPPGSGSGGTAEGSSSDGDSAAQAAGAPAAVQVGYTDQGGAGPLALAALSAFGGSAVFAVPAAVIGGPGLIILLWVLLQALGTATWIPAVRRLRGRDGEAA